MGGDHADEAKGSDRPADASAGESKAAARDSQHCNRERCLVCELEVLAERVGHTAAPFAASGIVACLNTAAQRVDFAAGAQEDAHEFIRLVLNTMAQLDMDACQHPLERCTTAQRQQLERTTFVHQVCGVGALHWPWYSQRVSVVHAHHARRPSGERSPTNCCVQLAAFAAFERCPSPICRWR